MSQESSNTDALQTSGLFPINQSSTKSFRKLLQDELIKRCERNSGYSLRAFARSLSMSHATLSGILSGRRPLTSKAIQKIGTSLGLSDSEISIHVAAQPHRKRKTPYSVASHYEIMPTESFNAISEWYYDAILELTRVTHFKGEASWISKSLGITVLEVNVAVERLREMGLLTVNADGKWIDTSHSNTTIVTNNLSTETLRKHQQKILDISQRTLIEVPKELRDHTSMTVAMSTADIETLKEMFKTFRRQVTSFLERKEITPDSVYTLSLAFFPLTQNFNRSQGAYLK